MNLNGNLYLNRYNNLLVEKNKISLWDWKRNYLLNHYRFWNLLSLNNNSWRLFYLVNLNSLCIDFISNHHFFYDFNWNLVFIINISRSFNLEDSFLDSWNFNYFFNLNNFFFDNNFINNFLNNFFDFDYFFNYSRNRNNLLDNFLNFNNFRNFN